MPRFSCTIGESVLKYRGWGTGYEHSRLTEHRNGFTVTYEAGGEVVGLLSLNADDDYKLADELVRSHTPTSQLRDFYARAVDSDGITTLE